jgi:hypothetical protein
MNTQYKYLVFFAALLLILEIPATEDSYSWKDVETENADGTFTLEKYKGNKLLIRSIFKEKNCYSWGCSYGDNALISEEWFDINGNSYLKGSNNDGIGNLQTIDRLVSKNDYRTCTTMKDGEIRILDSTLVDKSSGIQLAFDNSEVAYEGSGMCEYPIYYWLNNQDEISYKFIKFFPCTNNEYFPSLNTGQLSLFQGYSINGSTVDEGDEIELAYCHY